MLQDKNMGVANDTCDSQSGLDNVLPDAKPQQPPFGTVGQRNLSRMRPFAYGQFYLSTCRRGTGKQVTVGSSHGYDYPPHLFHVLDVVSHWEATSRT